MKRLMFALAAGVAAFAVCFLGTAFIEWTLDPSKWDLVDRMALVFFGAVFSGSVTISALALTAECP